MYAREAGSSSLSNSAGLGTVWTFISPYGSPDRPFVMAGDRLIGIFEKRKIYAIDVYRGHEVVRDKGFPRDCVGDPAGTLTLADGTLFFVDDHQIQAVDVATGIPRADWKPIPGRGVKNLIAYPGCLFAILDVWGKQSVAGYSPADGTPAWSKPYPLPQGSAGAIGVGDDAFFFAFENQLYAVNHDFGDTRFPNAKSNVPPFTGTLNETQAPLVGDNVVVCTGAGDQFYGFDRNKGGLKWTFPAQSDGSATTWTIAMSEDRSWIAAANSSGAVSVVATDTGIPIAQTTVSSGAVPTIAGDDICLTGASDGSFWVLRVDPKAGTFTRINEFSLPIQAADVVPTIGDGHIYVPTDDGNVSAFVYSEEQAAYFDGSTTSVAVTVDPTQFDFDIEAGDFSMEAWVHGSCGGEILSSYPAAPGSESHGFRFNLGSRGEIRFAVVNADESNRDVARTGPTSACDGNWHHVAATRRAGAITFYLDGLSIPAYGLQSRNRTTVYSNGNALDGAGKPILNTLTLPPPPHPCKITPQAGLTIGAYVASAGATASDHFTGLLREVRVWDVGLDGPAVRSKKDKLLPPNVPHLWGNWHLDASDAADIATNDVDANTCAGTFNGTPLFTDLTLDDSAFPYLLHQRKLQWPYASSWIARGEYAIEGPAALNTDGVVCFRTNNALYGINGSDASRRWSLPVKACSTPVAYGQAFYATTDEFGVIEIDSKNGTYAPADGLASMPTDGASSFAAPTTDGRFLAAASRDGTVWVVDFSKPGSAPATFSTAGDPGDLTIDAGILYTAAGGQLFAIDLAANTTMSAAVSSAVFCVGNGFVFCVQNGQLVRTDRTLAPATAAASSTTVTGGAITGLALDADSNLLIVSTNQGVLLGLTLTLGQRWSTAIPDGKATSPSAVNGWLHAPVMGGRAVFCSSRSGAVAAVDGRTGVLLGFFTVPNAVVTPPVQNAGVVYFGCDDPGPRSLADGALHSVIFGETYVLRLDLKPDDTTGIPGYASIQSPPLEPFYFSDPQQCCVEAWINTSLGGEIFSLCPSTTALHPGVRLSVDATASVLRFALIGAAQDSQPGTIIAASAPGAAVLDGSWHHVAVSCKSAADIRIYIDGKSQTVTLAEPAASAVAAVTGIHACIGANATGLTTTPNYFTGLIAEVRLWDSYLIASEISDRMHDKLLGFEPDLLAYWNFDTVGVNDAGPNQLNGSVAGAAGFWLSDLTFEHPDYPYFTTQASITQVGTTGLQPSDRRAWTEYQLIVNAHKADGTAADGVKVTLWYVRHQDIGEPDAIKIQTSAAETTMKGVPPGQSQDAAHAVSLTTDSLGRIALTVKTLDLQNGPSFDVYAPYMPANERYHVNCLLNNQKLAKPALPHLIAQSKLLLDYHWSTGSVINSSRGRPTYRITITTLSGDDSPRGNERLELYSTGFLNVEVKGKPYSLSADNGQAFYTDPDGELTLIVDAKDVKSDSLSVWAGFMNQQARYNINPTEDAHNSLSAVQGGAISSPKMTRWAPPSEGGPQQKTLLQSADQPDAEQIAGSIRHVMATATGGKPVPPEKTATSRRRAAQAAPPALAQRPAVHRGDVMRTLPTLRHIQRRGSVTPEAGLASIQAVKPGAIGFSYTANGSGTLQFAYLSSMEEAHAAIATRTRRADVTEFRVQGWLSSAWDDIKDGAEDAYDAAQQVVVTIDNAINVVIDSVATVVHTIEEAVSAVVSFLKQLAILLVEIIEFLFLLFDFKAIIDAHFILKDTFTNLPGFVDRTIADVDISSALRGLVDHAFGVSPDHLASGSPGTSLTAIRQQHDGEPNQSVSSSNSPGARWGYSKAKENSGTLEALGDPDSSPIAQLEQALSDFVQGLLEIVGEIPTDSPDDLGSQILALLRRLGQDAATAGVELLIDALSRLSGVMDELIDGLGESIDIPFISALYRWIVGADLSLLDLICLALAIMVHVVYAVTTGRKFRDDASGLADLFAAPAEARALVAEAPRAAQDDPYANPLTYSRPDSHAIESVYVCCQCMNVAAQILDDAAFVFLVQGRGNPGNPGSLFGVLRIFRAITGMTASSLLFVCSTPAFLQDILDELRKNQISPRMPTAMGIQKYYEYKTISIFVATMLMDGNTGYTGLKNLRGARAGSRNLLGQTPEQQYTSQVFMSVLEFCSMLFDIIESSGQTEYSPPVTSDVRNGAWCLFGRDMFHKAAQLPSFMFSRTGAEVFTPEVLGAVAAARGLAAGASVALHAVGEFKFLEHYDADEALLGRRENRPVLGPAGHRAEANPAADDVGLPSAFPVLQPAFTQEIRSAAPASGQMSAVRWAAQPQCIVLDDGQNVYGYQSNATPSWTITTQNGLNGWSIWADNVYVQDGSVLCQYNVLALNQGTVAVPDSAVDLDTSTRWSAQEGGTPAQFNALFASPPPPPGQYSGPVLWGEASTGPQIYVVSATSAFSLPSNLDPDNAVVNAFNDNFPTAPLQLFPWFDANRKPFLQYLSGSTVVTLAADTMQVQQTFPTSATPAQWPAFSAFTASQAISGTGTIQLSQAGVQQSVYCLVPASPASWMCFAAVDQGTSMSSVTFTTNSAAGVFTATGGQLLTTQGQPAMLLSPPAVVEVQGLWYLFAVTNTNGVSLEVFKLVTTPNSARVAWELIEPQLSALASWVNGGGTATPVPFQSRDELFCIAAGAQLCGLPQADIQRKIQAAAISVVVEVARAQASPSPTVVDIVALCGVPPDAMFSALLAAGFGNVQVVGLLYALYQTDQNAMAVFLKGKGYTAADCLVVLGSQPQSATPSTDVPEAPYSNWYKALDPGKPDYGNQFSDFAYYVSQAIASAGYTNSDVAFSCGAHAGGTIDPDVVCSVLDAGYNMYPQDCYELLKTVPEYSTDALEGCVIYFGQNVPIIP
ncbi:MAG: WD40-like repeat containing protein [Candidatus Eremiobacteraeota bacterium]|nr:WD40-like repeat containing protein [Candidatus Eremiobacteraeota bacterium]